MLHRSRWPIATLLASLALMAGAILVAGRPAEGQGYAPRAVVPMVAHDEDVLPPPPPPTSTPRPPATPTAPPTATPTPQPAGLRLQGTNWYTNRYTGSIWVVGLVINGLPSAVEYVEITANFYDAAGRLVASDFGFADISVMAPGGSSPFTVLLIDPPPGISHVDVAVTDYSPARRSPVTGLEVTITNIYRSITGTVHVVGTVRNTTATNYTYVEILGAFVDSAGTVIRTDFTFSQPSTLTPGQQGTFDMLFLDAPPGLEQLNLLIWTDASR